jgi:hypothetical protein
VTVTFAGQETVGGAGGGHAGSGEIFVTKPSHPPPPPTPAAPR